MAGRYKAYPAYKDSGVEWLGEIPEGWKVSCLKRCASINMGQSPNSEDCNQDQIGLPFLQGNAEFGAVYPMAKQYCPIPRKLAGKGDLLFSVRAPVGALNTADKVYGIGRGLCSIRSSEANCQKFIYWVLSTDINQLNAVSTGSTFEAVSVEQVSNLYLSLPHKSEQQTIAQFLDYETAKIDALIAKQEQLIELLKEKRQAVISHAVTKGLNPDAPMKDSGVEWLGQVPEHWQIAPLKYLCSFTGGGTPSKDNLSFWTDGNIPWVSPKDMKTSRIYKTQDYITETALIESSTQLIKQGALLIVVRSGILQRNIPIAINEVPVTLNQDMKALRFNNKINVNYVENLIIGHVPELLLEWSKEGATVESIEHEYLANTSFPVPPLDEQIQINLELEKFSNIYQTLETKAVTAIELLQERKTALISAAVTGKIDVRDWQPPSVG